MSLGLRSIILFGVLALFLSATVIAVPAGTPVSVDVSGIPLVFIANEGQAGEEVLYHANAPGHSIYFLKDAMVCLLPRKEGGAPALIRVSLDGYDPLLSVTAEEKLPGTANFLVGNDPQAWVRNVPTYGKVRYSGILPGVDIVYYGTQGVLKRDIILAPGVDPSTIRFRYTGQETLALDDEGNLLVETTGGRIREAAPLCYQLKGGEEVPVSCRYVLSGDGLVGFSIGTYDPALPLVIDPYLDFSTYLGGAREDRGYAVAVDSLGSTYVTGGTQSIDFPYPSWKARYQEFPGGAMDVFVTKIEPDGLALNYSTYIGGRNDDVGFGITVNESGFAYITGYTISPDYPVLKAFQDNISYSGSCCSSSDAFISVLAPEGNDLEFSSFLGGNMTDVGRAIALNSTGQAVLTGYTGSWDFPTTTGAYDRTLNGTWDAFVTGISYDGSVSTIGFSTFLGGENTDKAFGIALGPNNDIFVTGLTQSMFFPVKLWKQRFLSGSQDAFVTRLAPDASDIISSTYLGGFNDESGNGIAVDNQTAMYVTGFTRSEDFPVFPKSPYGTAFQSRLGGLQDAFLTKFNPGGTSLNFSTYLGGSQVEEGTGIAVDGMGSAYVTGYTDSLNFPVKNAVQSTLNSYTYDAFVSRFYPNGTAVMYSTYLGGRLDDRAMGIALLGSNATVAGWTESANFPVKNAIQSGFAGVSDAFVARIVSVPPVANFTAEANGVENYTLIKGLPPLRVNFTDLSTGEPTAWSWLLGDGNTSSQQNPSHTYYTGNWTVNLTASNLDGSNSTGKYWYIQVGAPLIVNFSAANVSGVPCTFCQGQVPFGVNFTDLTNDTPIAWNWSFGDGNFSTDQHTNWTYHIPGLYNVTLIATNDYGSNSTTKWGLVEAGDVPTANFTANVTSGIAPLAVQFTDLSTAIPAISSWNWTFGDGSPNGTTKNPVHVFTAMGNYTVNLTVRNLWGNGTMSRFEYIRVGEIPVADFTAEPTSIVESQAVNFTDLSTGYPTWWFWNFGDGQTENRTGNLTFNHTYAHAGNYTVSLTAGNEFGSSTKTRPRYIFVAGNATVANLTFVPSSAIIPTNSTTAMKLILEKAERGLSGYNITIYFVNPSAADMVAFHLPSWVNPAFALNSTVPASSVWLKVSDIADVIRPGATNVELALFNSTGKTPMATTINVTVTQIDTDTGDIVHTYLNPAQVTIVALLPLPGHANPPTDPFHDGVYWDVNGNGRIDFDDVVQYFLFLEWIQDNEPISLFDYNDNGRIDFDDLFILFTMV
ncbi:MAG: PKD domain-containing protein [Methanolinea sp.]|nr:PKD domain-containing protein [Methanolinea sp.]